MLIRSKQRESVHGMIDVRRNITHRSTNPGMITLCRSRTKKTSRTCIALRRRSPRCSGKRSSRLGPRMSGPVMPIRGRVRGKGLWARRVSVGRRSKREVGPRMKVLSVARITGGARVVATAGLATTTRVTVATTMVGRAAVVKMG